MFFSSSIIAETAVESPSAIPSPKRRVPPGLVRARAEWPAERLATLRRLHDQGLSHLLIAREMGVSKGVISGKIQRLDWPATPTVVTARPPRPARSERRAAGNLNRERHDLFVDAEVADGVGIELLALTLRTCRWPIGVRRGETVYCGGETGWKTYCGCHRARASLGVGEDVEALLPSREKVAEGRMRGRADLQSSVWDLENPTIRVAPHPSASPTPSPARGEGNQP